MTARCQSCGNLMFSRYDLGTNKDGTLMKEYCSSCYRDGQLYRNENDMNHSAEMLLPFAAALGMGPVAVGGAAATGLGASADGIPAYPPPMIFDWDKE